MELDCPVRLAAEHLIFSDKALFFKDAGYSQLHP
jgi:hypothetical protein